MGDIWRSDLRRGKSRLTFRLDFRLRRYGGRAALTAQLEAPCGSHLACWEAKWHQGITPIQDDICFPQITAVCSVPDGFAEARSLSRASAVIWPSRGWGASPLLVFASLLSVGD